MSAVPGNLSYTAEHEWLLIDGDVATVGITQFAADALGDIVYVALPSVGDSIKPGAVVGEVESTKSVGEIFAPAAGEVLEANPGRRGCSRHCQRRSLRKRLADQNSL